MECAANTRFAPIKQLLKIRFVHQRRRLIRPLLIAVTASALSRLSRSRFARAPFRLVRLHAVFAFLIGAFDAAPRRLHELRAAFRSLLPRGDVPAHEISVGVAGAAVIGLSLF